MDERDKTLNYLQAEYSGLGERWQKLWDNNGLATSLETIVRHLRNTIKSSPPWNIFRACKNFLDECAEISKQRGLPAPVRVVPRHDREWCQQRGLPGEQVLEYLLIEPWLDYVTIGVLPDPRVLMGNGAPQRKYDHDQGEAARREVLATLDNWLNTINLRVVRKKKRRKQKCATVNERMKLEMLANLEETKGWTAQQWANHLGCAKSTVVESETWKSLSLLRQQAKAERRNDRSRK